MLAYGVVFVLLLGEIDLSIGYLSGIAAVTVADAAPGRHNFPGSSRILIGLAIVAALGAAQGRSWRRSAYRHSSSRWRDS